MISVETAGLITEHLLCYQVAPPEVQTELQQLDVTWWTCLSGHPGQADARRCVGDDDHRPPLRRPRCRGHRPRDGNRTRGQTDGHADDLVSGLKGKDAGTLKAIKSTMFAGPVAPLLGTSSPCRHK